MSQDTFHISQYVFFSDFDGTITAKDSNVELVRRYGDRQVLQNEARFVSGEASNREILIRHYAHMRVTPQQYYDTLYGIPIDPGFAGFCHALIAADGNLTVLTASGAEGVHSYLAKHGFGDIPVRGNHLVEEDGAMLLKGADTVEDSVCQMGKCAHCKTKWLKAARAAGKKVAYIGDGITDECAVRHADMRFAKSSLAAYCRRQGIPFVPFTGFAEIRQHLFG